MYFSQQKKHILFGQSPLTIETNATVQMNHAYRIIACSCSFLNLSQEHFFLSLNGSHFDLSTLFSSLEWFEQANCATLFTTHSWDCWSMDGDETGREERIKSAYTYFYYLSRVSTCCCCCCCRGKTGQSKVLFNKQVKNNTRN